MTKLRRLVAQQADYAANKKRLDQLEALVNRFAEIARNTVDPKWGKRLRARRSQLEREKKQAVAKPALDQSSISLDIKAAATKADIALQVNGYSKRFGERVLFEGAGLEIACGERIALVGPNGCGKTTFLKDVVETASWESSVLRIGPSLIVGYCAQNQDTLNPDFTILQEFLSLGPGTRDDVFAVLSRFLFAWEDMDKRIADLSGGEKNRLQLARVTMQGANFLLLDEPTNHMDIRSREAIEDSLAGFAGTILVVSHDRYFLDKITTGIVEIRDGTLHSYTGNFSEFWLERERSAAGLEGRVSTRDRQYRRALRQRAPEAGPQPDRIEGRIAALEKQKVLLEDKLAGAVDAGDQHRGRQLASRLEKLARQIDRLYAEWMREE
jgi:ATP-binding cassette subfamily F protein 3